MLVEKRNSDVHLRPRFSIELNADFDSVLQLFAEAFEDEKTTLKGNIVDGHIFIKVPDNEDHFWSPQLHLEVLENLENTSTLKGLFGPKPQVWTLFMFIHFLLFTGFLGFLVMLYSRISLNGNLFFPICMLVVIPFVWGLLYFIGKIGKETGKNQMKLLHDFMLQVIDE